jgi:hypothetical protein
LDEKFKTTKIEILIIVFLKQKEISPFEEFERSNDEGF